MRIKQIRIQSFRGIKDAEVILDRKLTVLVGANNAGKTTVLDALAAVVTYRRGAPAFLDTDFRAESTGADVREAQPIAVTLTLVPSADDPRFEAGELGQLRPQQSADRTEHLRLRLTAQYSAETGRIETRLVDLDPEDGEVSIDGHGAFPFRELLPFRAFGAERDLRRGMGGRWSDWSLILNEVRPTSDTLRQAAQHFGRGSKVLIENTEDLTEIANALRPAFLRSVGEDPPQNLAACVNMLRERNYFTCSPGECLELELAAIEDGRSVDQIFLAKASQTSMTG